MKFLLLALLGVLAGIQANINEVESNFYKREYHKNYSEIDDLHHMQVYRDNKRMIEAHNKRDVDRMRKEKEQFNLDEINERDEEEEEEDFKADKTVDWRKLGAVTPVQSEGSLPNSWAFAVAGVVESSKFVTTGKLVELSKQNLIDCCKFKGKDRIAEALSCIKSMGGIDTQESYPYRGANNSCKFNKGIIGAKVKDIEISEVTLAKMVAKGPVAASISEDVIHSYNRNKGIFKTKCRMVTHGRYFVLIVGYGNDPHDGDYWLLKTSKGATWGEEGYIRLARNMQNFCIIDETAYRPVIEA